MILPFIFTKWGDLVIRLLYNNIEGENSKYVYIRAYRGRA